MNYILEYPTYFIALCICCGALYTFILYRKERLLTDVPVWLKVFMGSLRFLSVSIIALLLLGILIKEESQVIEKPVIIVGHDVSKSILLSKDSTFYKEAYRPDFLNFVQKLKKKYQVEFFTFGDEVTTENTNLSFTDKQSDISSFLGEITNRFQNRNIGAVVLATDGIYNKGFDPLSLASSIANTGIYTIALGDTTIKRDLMIDKVNTNKVAYLGNDFPVEVLVKADKLKGKTTVLELYSGNTLIASDPIKIEQSVNISNHNFRVEAKTAGVRKYTLKLKNLEGEFTLDNNTSTFFVDIQNNREKILLLGNGPHPDLGAIKTAIESNDAYEVDLKFAKNFDGVIKSYGLIVLHQLPSGKFASEALITAIKNANKPVWFILGAQTSFGRFNKIKTGLTHIGYRGELDPVSADLNGSFSLFNINDEIKNAVDNLPVIHVPFGTIKKSGSVTTLFNKKIGNFIKEEPLIAFNTWNNTRTAFTTGEGMWRWKLANTKVFNQLVLKITQYLATREDKSFFRVLAKNTFLENDRITFDAELFNKSYELVTNGEISTKITGDDGTIYNYDFAVNGSGYRLNAGSLPVGKYIYEATAILNGKTYTKNGEFSVKEIKVEFANTVANHQLLFNIAHKNGGEMFFPAELDKLYQSITAREDLVEVVYPYSSFSDIINWKWIFFLIVGLLCLEWFLRKRNGAY